MDAKGIGKSGIASVSADLRKPDGKNVSPERFPFLSPNASCPFEGETPLELAFGPLRRQRFEFFHFQIFQTLGLAFGLDEPDVPMRHDFGRLVLSLPRGLPGLAYVLLTLFYVLKRLAMASSSFNSPSASAPSPALNTSNSLRLRPLPMIAS